MPGLTDSPAAIFAGPDASPFGRRQRRARGARIPVSIVTGFLGVGQDDADPRGAGDAGGRGHRGRRQRIRRGRDRRRAVARLDRHDRIARQWVRMLPDAQRPAGNPAHPVRRAHARRNPEFPPRHHRDQRPRRPRPGIADLCQRPRARRRVPPAIAGRGRRRARRPRQPRRHGGGAASGRARRPHRNDQDRPGPAGRGGCAERIAADAQRGPDRNRPRGGRSMRNSCSTMRSKRRWPRRTSITSMPMPTASPALPCSSTSRSPGRSSNRRWRC